MKRSKSTQATDLIQWIRHRLIGLPIGKQVGRLLSGTGMSRLAGFVFLVAIAISGCSSHSESWSRIADSGVLIFGLDPTYPPFEMAVGDQLSGLDVDLAREMGRDLGLEARFVHFGYDGLYDALATGQVDVLISALVILPERTGDFAYTEPYFNAGQIMIARADEPIDDVQGLDGKRLAVELGAQGHVLASTWQRRLSRLEILPLGTADEAMSAVATGLADAALIDAISGRLFLGASPELTWNGEYMSDEPYALVVRAEDQKLLEQLNESLRRLNQAGELGNLVDRWLGGS